MWSGKAGFLWFAVAQFLFVPAWPYFYSMILAAATWGYSFDRARKSVFSQQYRLYPERIKYFAQNYQYIRYVEFRERLQSGPYLGSITDAIDFLNEQIETESPATISAHPVMTILIGTLFAVLGAAAAQWSAKVIIYTLLSLVLAMYFAAIVLGLKQTKQADLKEFKRFLLWASDEQIEIKLLHVESARAQSI